VYVNGFSASGTERWRSWLQEKCEPLGLAGFEVDASCPPGNVESYLHLKQRALALPDPQTIVLLLEDDYLLQPTALLEMVEVGMHVFIHSRQAFH
jgi:hypothetical protein